MDKTGLDKVTNIRNGEARQSDRAGQRLPALAVREELERIVCHPSFRASQRLKNFLRYVVEETVEGHGEDLKEYAIAIDVFQRDSSFDPRVDNIVRVEAGRLRARLAEYYAQEGINDPLKIEFVKGRYAPVFRSASETQTDRPAPERSELGIQKEKGSLLRRESAPMLPSAPAQSSKSAAIFNRKLAFLALVTLLSAGSVIAWLLWKNAQPGTDMKSIMVVPFQNLGDNKEDEFLSDGLSDDVITSLSRFQGLRVVSRRSAFELKGKPISLPELSKQYKVNSVLEGTVRRYGDNWHITVQLVDSQRGYNLWSQIYERDAKNVRTVHDEISVSIAGALGVKLGSAIQPLNRNITNADPEAYQDYLMGLYLWKSDRLASEDRLRQSIVHFSRAIAKDPNYAPAYVWLSKCYAAQWPSSKDSTADEILGKSRAAALKALELDGSQGEAYVALGLISTYEFDWQKAEENFKRALDLVPGSAYARQRYASYLMRVGRPAESAFQAREEAQMDPVFLARLGFALYHSREFDEAIKIFEQALVLNPNESGNHNWLGMVYIQKGWFDKGITELVKADPSYIGDLGYGFAASGNRMKAQAILAQLMDRSKTERGSALGIARIYIGLGEKEKAFEWLSKAINEHDFRLVLPTDPVYDSLRSDPRYSELLKQMKLN